ncbi:MAG: hypothetical protein AMJ65_13515 [Phycisphaerae bacterium SG8_4]|nr:MAG: hypothetical protein AMJ65_13515 [Phycisphaerae bacterium SG8_4]
MVVTDFREQIDPGRKRDNKVAGTGGRIGLTLFFLVFFLMGSVFELMIAREFLARVKRHTWQGVSCTMLQSQVKETSDSDHPYALEVQYEYQYGGRSYQADCYSMDYRGSDSYDKTSKLAHRYAPGSPQRCYVNPSMPQQAVLARGSLWFGLVLLFPLIFVAIGLGGIICIWRRAGNQTKPKRIAITGRKRPAVAAVFFGIFAVVGIGVLIPLFIMPMIRILDARDWQSIPCRILRSEVRSHEGDDSTTYSVHILYEYEFNGQTYRTDRYSFIGGSSSGYKGKRLIVDRYKVGSEALCWVDPTQPAEAVLFRGFSPVMWFGLIPAVFILVGVGGITGTLRRKRSQSGHGVQPDWLSDAPSTKPACGNLYADNLGSENGPVELKPRCSRIGKFTGVLIFAAIWDAIVVFMVMTRLPNGPANPVPLPIVVIFTLFGIALIAGVIYQFMALFNPIPHLRLSAAQVSLGDRLTVDWKISGQVNRLVRLTLTLTGKETAQYRRGTRTCTARRAFHKTELVALTDSVAMQQGCTEFVIPADSMHSFRGDNNQVIWSLTLHGDIPRWPDIRETFELLVVPMTTDQIARLSAPCNEEVAWAIPVESDAETV